MLPTSNPQDTPPAFGIVVYIRRDEAGRMHGRAANLVDVKASAATERELYQKLLPVCKTVIRDAIAAGAEQPLLTTPMPMLPEEQKRFFPLHL